MKRNPTMRSVTAVLLLAAMGVAAAGCDSVGNDAVTLRKEVDFRFEFSTSGGETVQATSVAAVRLDDVLSEEGFTRDAVISAQVQAVTVDRVSPAGTPLSVFDSLSFTLLATGVAVPSIAEADDVPSGREVALHVLVRDVTQAVTQPTFRARLTAVPATSAAESYVLTASMDVVVQVEGV